MGAVQSGVWGWEGCSRKTKERNEDCHNITREPYISALEEFIVNRYPHHSASALSLHHKSAATSISHSCTAVCWRYCHCFCSSLVINQREIQHSLPPMMAPSDVWINLNRLQSQWDAPSGDPRHLCKISRNSSNSHRGVSPDMKISVICSRGRWELYKLNLSSDDVDTSHSNFPTKCQPRWCTAAKVHQNQQTFFFFTPSVQSFVAIYPLFIETFQCGQKQRADTSNGWRGAGTAVPKGGTGLNVTS